MISSQMLKGMMEGYVFSVIRQKKTYGYEISDQLMAYEFGIAPFSTVYEVSI